MARYTGDRLKDRQTETHTHREVDRHTEKQRQAHTRRTDSKTETEGAKGRHTHEGSSRVHP